MADLLIRNVRPFGGATVDVLIQGAAIVEIAASGLSVPDGAAVEDGAGALLLPGLIEGHAHLDKTLWGGPWYRNAIGPTRNDRIENERLYRRDGAHDAEVRSLKLALAYLGN